MQVHQTQELGGCIRDRNWAGASDTGTGWVHQRQELGRCIRHRNWAGASETGTGQVHQTQELGRKSAGMFPPFVELYICMCGVAVLILSPCRGVA